METQIIADNLSVSFDKKKVFENVSFTLKKGQYLALVGPNGAGKSTLVKTIVGQCRAYRGRVVVKDRKSIGYVSQLNNDGVYFPARVIEVIKSGFAKRLFNLPVSRKSLEYMHRVIDALELNSLLNSSFFNLSGGQKRAVLIARALCSGSSILILDEPCSSLDVNASNRLYRLIRTLNREHQISIIMISHDIDSVVNEADSVLCLTREPKFFSDIGDFKKDREYGELFK